MVYQTLKKSLILKNLKAVHCSHSSALDLTPGKMNATNNHAASSLKNGFQVLTAVSMKMAVFWVVALCTLVYVYRLFIARIMDSATTSETSLSYQTTKRYNTEGGASFKIHFIKSFHLL
jgi:hypothetical protein